MNDIIEKMTDISLGFFLMTVQNRVDITNDLLETLSKKTIFVKAIAIHLTAK